ncbi:MAG: FGGY-family carbohydrate kinase [Beutenbergiaceae bacterium]
MDPTLTIDIGTTSVKIGLFGQAAQPLGVERYATPTAVDRWGETYDVAALLALMRRSLAGLEPATRATISRIAITGVGESGGLVRDDLTLASPMILWHDQRGSRHLERLTETDRQLIYHVTGLPAHGNYSLGKVAWALEHADSAAVGWWLNVSEYLAAHMTGTRWAEYSLASRTMALDLRRRTWSQQVCSLLGVDSGVFPPLRRAGVGAPIDHDFARAVGLNQDVLVHVAGHDHMVGAVGAGVRDSEVLNSTGTTEAVLVHRDNPSTGPQSHRSKLANGLAPTGDAYTIFASIPTGGAAFGALQSLLGLDRERLAGRVQRVFEQYRAGRIDLARIPVVVPYFRGSPPPAKNPAARAVISGLGADTSSEELIFGTFLGLAVQLREVLGLFPAQAEEVKVIGPASRNGLWLQLKADLLGMPVQAASLAEVVSRGAQALAADQAVSWQELRPNRIAVDVQRHRQLQEWVDRHDATWRHHVRADS